MSVYGYVTNGPAARHLRLDISVSTVRRPPQMVTNSSIRHHQLQLQLQVETFSFFSCSPGRGVRVSCRFQVACKNHDGRLVEPLTNLKLLASFQSSCIVCINDSGLFTPNSISIVVRATSYSTRESTCLRFSYAYRIQPLLSFVIFIIMKITNLACSEYSHAKGGLDAVL